MVRVRSVVPGGPAPAVSAEILTTRTLTEPDTPHLAMQPASAGAA